MSFFYNIFSYTKLFINLWSYSKDYKNNDHNSILIDNLLDNVSNCGAVMIKFCQWITPKLELIYLETNDIIKDKKPPWLIKLEKY